MCRIRFKCLRSVSVWLSMFLSFISCKKNILNDVVSLCACYRSCFIVLVGMSPLPLNSDLHEDVHVFSQQPDCRALTICNNLKHTLSLYGSEQTLFVTVDVLWSLSCGDLADEFGSIFPCPGFSLCLQNTNS